MNDPIIITEVIGRAVQGMTKPFLCRAGFFDYYVKGAYAGLDSLCCEWVANRLVNCVLPSAPLGLPMFAMEPLMKAALAEVPAIFAELPLEWLHLDGDESLPVQLDMKRVISGLELPFTDPDTFWKLP